MPTSAERAGAGAGTAAAPSTIRRLLLLANRRPATDRSPLIPDLPAAAGGGGGGPKKGFAFRGLGCASASSSQALAPAASAAAEAVRASADWPGKRPRRPRRVKQKKRRGAPAAAVAAEVWCAPGIAFAADVPVDCVVRGARTESDRRPGASASAARRGGGSLDRLSSCVETGSDDAEAPMLAAGQLRQLRGCRRSPGGLEEIMMFQTRLLLGAMDAYDQYRDLRLDVDGMSYEELLELGDKIGRVSTGLREEEILYCLKKSKNPCFAGSSFRFSEMERKCCICQEEYDVNDEIGRLHCGHSYHAYCIKQWLLQKNACPVCKSVVNKI